MASRPGRVPAAPTPADLRDGREARQVAVVMIATMALWLGGLWLGGHFGWAERFAFLFDFAALAGFVWVVVVMIRMWRRQSSRAGGK